MNPNDVAPMVMGVTLFLVTGAVILLRPLSKRLGELLEVMIRERSQPQQTPELEQVRDLLLSMDSRLRLLEERQSFDEALLATREARPFAPPQPNGTAALPREAAPRS